MKLLAPVSAFFHNPLFAAYNANRKHRFHNYILASAALIIYEVLILFFKTPQIEKVEGHDIWFQILYKYLPFHTLVPSVSLLIFMGFYIRMDYLGIKDRMEIELENLMKLKEPSFVYKKPQWRFDYIHGLRMLAEALIFSAVIFAALPFISEKLTEAFAPDAPLPGHFPRQLMDYQTTAMQSIALACGSGFYEELIFRYGLIKILNRFFKKRIPPISALLVIPLEDKYKGFRHKLVAVLIAALIYSFSHFMLPFLHPNAETFTVYNLFYRWIYGIILSYILIYRKFGVAVWTHIFYELFYFGLY
ncbi:MAG: CPBP family intramembrane metalloprotease [Bacteroidia bacterium]|nr:CPBP family intramembrane metalloprotease [Bacteroidia bacterium]